MKEMRAHKYAEENRKELLDTKRELIKARKAKAPKTEVSQLENKVTHLEGKQEEIKGLIRDAKYEQKWLQPRMSNEQYAAKAEESAQKIRDLAFSHDEEFAKKAARNLELDQKYLVQEMKLLERGEVPPGRYRDTYQRVQDSYGKVYDDMIRKLSVHRETLLNQAKKVGREALESQTKGVEDALAYLKQARRRQQAVARLQEDSLVSKAATKGAGGAFTRNDIRKALGELIKENSNLQKAIFKAEKAAPSAESAGKYINARFHMEGMPKTAGEARKILEEAGVDKETLKAAEDLIKKTEEAAAKAGKTEAQAEKEWLQKAAKTGGKVWNFLKNPWTRRLFKLATGSSLTWLAARKKVLEFHYEGQLQDAKKIRDKDINAGSKRIAEIKKNMKLAKFSNADIKRAEVAAGIKNY
jgi:hypothetical protein